MPNVDVMFSWKPSDSENSGSDHVTFTRSPLAASNVWFPGQNSRVGGNVSVKDVSDALALFSFEHLHHIDTNALLCHRLLTN